MNINQGGYDLSIEDKKYIFKSIPLRFLVLLLPTILVSVIYKGVIELGVFDSIPGNAHWFIFCGFEFLLLGLYWYFIYVYAGACRYHSDSPASYYFITIIDFAVFSAIYYGVFRWNQDVFSWVFRVTLNLIGIRLKTDAPDNLLPYMIAYLAITFFILMMEPVVDRIKYNRYVTYQLCMQYMENMKRQ